MFLCKVLLYSICFFSFFRRIVVEVDDDFFSAAAPLAALCNDGALFLFAVGDCFGLRLFKLAARFTVEAVARSFGGSASLERGGSDCSDALVQRVCGGARAPL